MKDPIPIISQWIDDHMDPITVFLLLFQVLSLLALITLIICALTAPTPPQP